MLSGTARPRQKLPFSKKDKDWRINSFKHFSFATTDSANQRKHLEHLYKVAEGVLDEMNYEHVLNPLGEEGTKNPQYKSFPAKLRNYDIISPIVNSLVGQMIEMGFDFVVTNKAIDVENEYLAELNKLMKQNILIHFNNALQDAGFDTGIPKEEAKPVEEIKGQAQSYNAQKSKEGRIIMEYITAYNELPMKFLVCWYDFIVTGTCFSRRDVFQDETVFEPINPLNFRYQASENVRFVEDAESQSVDYFMTASEAIDFFYGEDEFTDEMIDYIESRNFSASDAPASRSFATSDYFGEHRSKLFKNLFGDEHLPKRDGNVKVTHTCWKSPRKIGKLIYKDIFGEEHIEEVTEDFVPMKGEKVEWIWVSEAWEGFSIDDKYYLAIAPIPLQRGSLDNPTKCKLIYNGKALDTRVTQGKSIVERGLVFQEKYNIIQYNIEMTINKNLDKIILMPLSLVPDSEDMDMFSQMYYTKAAGYMYIDDSDKAKRDAMSNVRVLDTNLNNYIQYLYGIASAIKEEYESQIGFVRQRKGEINSSDTVSGTQQAIFRGSLITAYQFEQFRQFQQRDLQALLDLSKFAFIEGKKSQFITSAGKEEWLKLEPENVSQASYGLFVKNSIKEQQMRDMLKERTQEFAQNGSTPSDIAMIIKSTSFDEVEDYLRKKEKEMMAMNQAQQQAEQEAIQYKQKSENFNKAEDRRIKEEDSIRKSETDILVANIQALNQMESSINSQLPSFEGDTKNDALAMLNDIDIKRKELLVKERDSQRKAQATKYKADTDLAIAKENKYKHEVK